jgi:hypothetical protein
MFEVGTSCIEERYLPPLVFNNNNNNLEVVGLKKNILGVVQKAIILQSVIQYANSLDMPLDRTGLGEFPSPD